MIIKNKRIELYYSNKSSIDDLKSPLYQKEIISHFINEYISKSGRAIKILDFGTGIGSNIEILNRYGYKSITAIDISQKAIDLCKSRFRKFPNIQFYVFNGKSLPFKDAFFDLVICTEVLEHVADLYFVSSELKRVTSNAGYLLVSTPNYFNLSGLIKVIIDLFSKEKDWNPWGAHKGGFERLFFWFQLQDIFNDRFTIIEAQGRDILLSWFYFFRHYFSSKFANILLLLPKKFQWMKYFSMNYYVLFKKNEV